MGKTQFIASGDSFITRRIPKDGYPGFEDLKKLIRENDVAFNNLEMTFHDREGTPAAESGGTWAMTEPGCLDDLAAFGFNLFSTANNHSGDYGEGGILATVRHLKERDMVFSGTGANLFDAARACYLETKEARIGLVSASSTFPASSAAGGQNGAVTGRPGVNPLRFQTTYHVTEEYFDAVKKLSEITCINAYEEYGIRLGYLNPKPDNTKSFGKYQFELDQVNEVRTAPDPKDLARITGEVEEMARQADAALVSLHVHEPKLDDMTIAPEFMETAAKACIDAGAKVVIGHGPHELRGFEFYHGGLILYSLGNFIFETETISMQPYDAFYKKGLPQETKIGAYMSSRSKDDTQGYPVCENIWRSVLAGWTIEDGNITEVRFYPITLGFGRKRTERGIPALSYDDETLEYFNSLSRPYGCEIEIRDHVGYFYPKG